jgi:hypothetical protein
MPNNAGASANKGGAPTSRSGSHGGWNASMYQLRRSCRRYAGPLEEADRIRRVEDHQSLDVLGVLHGQQPSQRAAPVVPGDCG